MEHVTTFMQTTKIHGLGYISRTRTFVRLFWILVVIGGWTGAAFFLHKSFQNWEDSPIKTTIETRPMTDGLTFPKVTVCPPTHTYTDLNYDLMMVENITLENKTRNELKDYAIKLLNDSLYDKEKENFTEYFSELFQNYTLKDIILALNRYSKDGINIHIISKELFERIATMFSLKYKEIRKFIRNPENRDAFMETYAKGTKETNYPIYLNYI